MTIYQSNNANNITNHLPIESRSQELPENIDVFIHKTPIAEQLKKILIKLEIINEKGEVQQDFKLPRLEESSMQALERLLQTSFAIQELGISFTLKEIFERLSNEKDLCSHVHLVGGMVLNILGVKFFEKCLKNVAVNNTSLIDENIKQKIVTLPYDIDVRYRLKNSSQLIKTVSFFNEVLASKILHPFPHKILEKHGFQKKIHVIDHPTEFYLVSTKTVPVIESIFVANLQKDHLFSCHSGYLDLSCFYQTGNFENLTYLSNYVNIHESILHLMLMIIDAKDLTSMNHLGFPMYISFLTKGYVCLKGEIEKTLVKSFASYFLEESSAFYYRLPHILKSVLSNHFSEEYDHIYLIYNLLWISSLYLNEKNFKCLRHQISLFLKSIEFNCLNKQFVADAFFKVLMDESQDEHALFTFIDQFLQNDCVEDPLAEFKIRKHCERGVLFIKFKGMSKTLHFLKFAKTSLEVHNPLEIKKSKQELLKQLIHELANESIYSYKTLLAAIGALLNSTKKNLYSVELFKIAPEIFFCIECTSSQKSFLQLLYQQIYSKSKTLTEELFFTNFFKAKTDFYQFKQLWAQTLIDSQRTPFIHLGLSLYEPYDVADSLQKLKLCVDIDSKHTFSLYKKIADSSSIDFFIQASEIYFPYVYKNLSTVRLENTVDILRCLSHFLNKHVNPFMQASDYQTIKFLRLCCLFAYKVHDLERSKELEDFITLLVEIFCKIEPSKKEEWIEDYLKVWGMIFSLTLKNQLNLSTYFWLKSWKTILVFKEMAEKIQVEKLVFAFLKHLDKRASSEILLSVLTLLSQFSLSSQNLKKISILKEQFEKTRDKTISFEGLAGLTALYMKVLSKEELNTLDLEKALQYCLLDVADEVSILLRKFFNALFDYLIQNIERNAEWSVLHYFNLYTNEEVRKLYINFQDFFITKSDEILKTISKFEGDFFRKKSIEFSLERIEELIVFEESSFHKIDECIELLRSTIPFFQENDYLKFNAISKKLVHLFLSKKEALDLHYLLLWHDLNFNNVLLLIDSEIVLKTFYQSFDASCLEETYKMVKIIDFYCDKGIKIEKNLSFLESILRYFLNHLSKKKASVFAFETYKIYKKYTSINDDLELFVINSLFEKKQFKQMIPLLQNFEINNECLAEIFLKSLQFFMENKKFKEAYNLIIYQIENKTIKLYLENFPELKKCFKKVVERILGMKNAMTFNEKLKLFNRYNLVSERCWKKISLEFLLTQESCNAIFLWESLENHISNLSTQSGLYTFLKVNYFKLLEKAIQQNPSIARKFLTKQQYPLLSAFNFSNAEFVEIYLLIATAVFKSINVNIDLTENTSILLSVFNLRKEIDLCSKKIFLSDLELIKQSLKCSQSFALTIESLHLLAEGSKNFSDEEYKFSNEFNRLLKNFNGLKNLDIALLTKETAHAILNIGETCKSLNFEGFFKTCSIINDACLNKCLLRIIDKRTINDIINILIKLKVNNYFLSLVKENIEVSKKIGKSTFLISHKEFSKKMHMAFENHDPSFPDDLICIFIDKTVALLKKNTNTEISFAYDKLAVISSLLCYLALLRPSSRSDKKSKKIFSLLFSSVNSVYLIPNYNLHINTFFYDFVSNLLKKFSKKLKALNNLPTEIDFKDLLVQLKTELKDKHFSTDFIRHYELAVFNQLVHYCNGILCTEFNEFSIKKDYNVQLINIFGVILKIMPQYLDSENGRDLIEKIFSQDLIYYSLEEFQSHQAICAYIFIQIKNHKLVSDVKWVRDLEISTLLFSSDPKEIELVHSHPHILLNFINRTANYTTVAAKEIYLKILSIHLPFLFTNYNTSIITNMIYHLKLHEPIPCQYFSAIIKIIVNLKKKLSDLFFPEFYQFFFTFLIERLIESMKSSDIQSFNERNKLMVEIYNVIQGDMLFDKLEMESLMQLTIFWCIYQRSCLNANLKNKYEAVSKNIKMFILSLNKSEIKNNKIYKDFLFIKLNDLVESLGKIAGDKESSSLFELKTFIKNNLFYENEYII